MELVESRGAAARRKAVREERRWQAVRFPGLASKVQLTGSQRRLRQIAHVSSSIRSGDAVSMASMALNLGTCLCFVVCPLESAGC